MEAEGAAYYFEKFEKEGKNLLIALLGGKERPLDAVQGAVLGERVTWGYR